MLEQMVKLFMQNCLRPLSFLSETVALDRKVNRSELTALLMLHFHGESTMSALAADLGAPLSTLTSLVNRLVRKDLVHRSKSPKDQRVMIVELTEEGTQLASEARAMMESMFARVQNALGQEELQLFLSLAVKVGKALQGKEGAPTPSQNQRTRKITIED